MTYHIQFGELPAESKRHNVSTIEGIRCSGLRSFTKEDEVKLEAIIKDQPQLYLDEIQELLFQDTGKVWKTNMIWRHMHTLGYSLKVAISEASQQDQKEIDLYHSRIMQVVSHLRQLIFVDETAKSANASRRRRVWSLRGVPAIVKSYCVVMTSATH